MSAINEMKRVKRTNLEHSAKRLRSEIEALTRTICINLDTSLCHPEDLPIGDVDSQFDELKGKWAELNQNISEVNRINEDLR